MKPRRAASAGPSRRWSISRAMRAGAAWPKARAKIHFLDLRWPPPTFAVIKAHGSTAGQHRRVRQALRRLRSGRRWPRLQHHRDLRTHSAAVLSAAVSRRRQSWDGEHHERLQLPERRSGVSESVYPEADSAEGWGFQGIVDSDWTSIGELIPHGIANDGAAAARRGSAGRRRHGYGQQSLPRSSGRTGCNPDVVPKPDVDERCGTCCASRLPSDSLTTLIPMKARRAPQWCVRNTVNSPAKPPSIVRTAKECERAGGVPLLPLTKSVAQCGIGPQADDCPNMLGAGVDLDRARRCHVILSTLVTHIGKKTCLT